MNLLVRFFRPRRQFCASHADGIHGPLLLAAGALFLSGCVNVFVLKAPANVQLAGNRSNTGAGGTNITNHVDGGGRPNLEVHP